MDILKASQNWVRSELISTPFFILFGVLFIVASIGFWQLGRTEIAKAYIIPTLIAGVLLMIVGFGLFFTNKSRLNQFDSAFKSDPSAFVESEISRSSATLKEYQTIVFRAIPIIIATCSIVIVFVDKPIWRASMITTIAMLVVILLIDGTAHARIDDYHQKIISLKQEG